MGIFEILFFSTALSIDALGIGISCELRNIKTPISARIVICCVSVAVTGTAVFMGAAISEFIPLQISKAISFIMLVAFGICIIFGSFGDNKKNKKPKKLKKENILNLAVKPLGITIRIIRNPVECDIDKSSSIDMSEACYIGLAISVDSFVAGLGAGVGGISGVIVPIMCGVCQMIFLCCGIKIGKKLHQIKFIKQKYFSIISGIMLIMIAILRIIF